MDNSNNVRPAPDPEPARTADPTGQYTDQWQSGFNSVLLNPPRKVLPRTILIPLAFLAIHFLVINIVAVIFIVGVLLLRAGTQGGFDINQLMDPVYLNQLISQYTSHISVIYALVLLPVYLVYLKLSARKFPDAFWSAGPRALDILPSLAIMAGVMGFTSLYFVFLDWLSQRVDLIERLMNDYIELADSAFSTSDNYLWLILGIGIAAPVIEELLFRGIIQGELRRAMPEWLAIVIQAILFAAFHMQPVQSTYVLIPGLLLGIGYAWSRSIWVPIIMHIFFNLLGSLVPSLIQSDEMLQQIVVIAEVAFIPIGIVAGIYFFLNRYTRRHQTGKKGEETYESAL